MPTPQKAQVIEQTQEWYSRAAGLVFADYRGLQVKEFQNLRKQLRAKGAEIHVIKNTLFRQAAGSDIDLFPADLHNGTTAIAFLFENESEGAKVLTDFAVSSKKLVVKGGYFGGKVFDAKGVEKIGKLPPREVLLAQVIGAVAAPLSSLIGTIEAIYAQPIRTIYAAADKLGADDVPAAAAPVAEAAPAAEAPVEEAAAEAPAEVAETEPAAEEAAVEAPADEPPAEEAAAEPAAEASEDTPNE